MATAKKAAPAKKSTPKKAAAKNEVPVATEPGNATSMVNVKIDMKAMRKSLEEQLFEIQVEKVLFVLGDSDMNRTQMDAIFSEVSLRFQRKVEDECRKLERDLQKLRSKSSY